jgi:hypothetical protein
MTRPILSASAAQANSTAAGAQAQNKDATTGGSWIHRKGFPVGAF